MNNLKIIDIYTIEILKNPFQSIRCLKENEKSTVLFNQLQTK